MNRKSIGIVKGEVDIKAVRERLEETVGKENIDKVAELYTDAYAGTGMSDEAIWEECKVIDDIKLKKMVA